MLKTTYRKDLSLEKLMGNMKSLTLTILKWFASIKFSKKKKKKKGHNPRVKNVAIHGTHYGKVLNMVKIKLQGQGDWVKTVATH